MAFKSLVTFLVSLYLSVVKDFSSHPTHGVAQLDKVSQVLFNAGYKDMSRVIQSNFPTLLADHGFNKTSGLTIFCPSDYAFARKGFTPAQPPPLGLLEYHVVPRKLEKEDLESSIRGGSEIDTLLPRHPLVVTTNRRVASLNEIEIVEWDVYNDGHVIVHGVNWFFDPSYDTTEYYSSCYACYMFICVLIVAPICFALPFIFGGPAGFIAAACIVFSLARVLLYWSSASRLSSSSLQTPFTTASLPKIRRHHRRHDLPRGVAAAALYLPLIQSKIL
ncbi:hypothetical protein Scep_023459 [Stephania cephalantha]|uniref:FAS1 domain-containing protein n=1 Tax=Stephania cephalantha TaxID=152367 RepID=A0AAP0F3P5_9MAGN